MARVNPGFTGRKKREDEKMGKVLENRCRLHACLSFAGLTKGFAAFEGAGTYDRVIERFPKLDV